MCVYIIFLKARGVPYKDRDSVYVIVLILQNKFSGINLLKGLINNIIRRF